MKKNLIFDSNTCQCVDPVIDDGAERDTDGCMPERLLQIDVDFGREV